MKNKIKSIFYAIMGLLLLSGLIVATTTISDYEITTHQFRTDNITITDSLCFSYSCDANMTYNGTSFIFSKPISIS